MGTGPGEGSTDDAKTTKASIWWDIRGGKRAFPMCGLYHWGTRRNLVGFDLAHLIKDLSCCYAVELLLASCFLSWILFACTCTVCVRVFWSGLIRGFIFGDVFRSSVTCKVVFRVGLERINWS